MGIGSDGQAELPDARAFMGQEGSQAQGRQMTCPFGSAGILEGPLIQMAPGPRRGNGRRSVQHERRDSGLPE